LSRRNFHYTLCDEYFGTNISDGSNMQQWLLDFRLPEGLGQTLLCFVIVFFNKLFMIYRRKCNWASTCKCTGIALDLPVGLSISGATWPTKSSILCLVNLNRCTSSVSVMYSMGLFRSLKTLSLLIARLPNSICSTAIFFYRKLIVRLVVSISPTLKWGWGQS
jgi:hypothetical protein